MKLYPLYSPSGRCQGEMGIRLGLDGLFLAEHRYFPLGTPSVAPGRAVGAYDAVARHAYIHAAIPVEYVTDRAGRVRPARLPGYFLVR